MNITKVKNISNIVEIDIYRNKLDNVDEYIDSVICSGMSDECRKSQKYGAAIVIIEYYRDLIDKIRDIVNE